MVLTEAQGNAPALQPTETASRGVIGTLFSSAFHLREVPRGAIGDAFEDGEAFIKALIGASMASSLLILGLCALSWSIEVGYVVAILILWPLWSLFTCVAVGGILSHFNSRIVGYKHGWREYQIFMSGAVWGCAVKVVIPVSVITGTLSLGLLAVPGIIIAAGYYTSLNYRSKLGEDRLWRTIHQIYATVAMGVLILSELFCTLFFSIAVILHSGARIR